MHGRAAMQKCTPNTKLIQHSEYWKLIQPRSKNITCIIKENKLMENEWEKEWETGILNVQ